MKNGNSGSSPQNINSKFKIINRIEKIKIASTLIIIIISIFYVCYDPYRKQTIYNSMDMSFLSARVVEYGTDNYDTRNVIENIQNGIIKEYTKDIDTTQVGTQQVTFEIGKEDVVKKFSTAIEVVDTKKPIIEFKQQEVKIYVGTNYDVKNNIKSVIDEIDGNIEYKEVVATENETGIENEDKIEEKKYYYTISTNLNVNEAGQYDVNITAYDKNGNETVETYKIKVIEKPKPKVYTYASNYTGPATVDTSSIVSTALSFVGYRYVASGESPSIGFDCSGLVKYVYSLHGKYLAHGTTYQSTSGYGVSRSEMAPGDIIIWSTLSNNYPTHAAIYIGNDQMVHAANPGQGVIVSSVSYWENNGGGHIATIRRVWLRLFLK